MFYYSSIPPAFVVNHKRIRPQLATALRTVEEKREVVPGFGGELCAGGVGWGDVGVAVDGGDGVEEGGGKGEMSAAEGAIVGDIW
jgi:hypothetical protein